jgi:2-dehydro-3-deoxyphosphooctonate aldolase (KDO 8-P synthase)
MAKLLAEARERLGIQLVFKASFDKANRTSIASFRGIEINQALVIFKQIKSEYGLPVANDFHLPQQAESLSEVVDVLQVPAFLCRQTDMLITAAHYARVVTVKKGQFLSPWEVKNIINKLVESGCKHYALIERGTSFGYNNLVSDMRSIPIMQGQGTEVIFDTTHSAQMPGGGGDHTAGMREYIPVVARAAVAAGCDGIFMEVHDQPERALSDSTTQWPFDRFEELVLELLAYRKTYIEAQKIGKA